MELSKRAERVTHVIVVLIIALVLCYGQDATTLLLFVILALDLISYLNPDDEKRENDSGVAIE